MAKTKGQRKFNTKSKGLSDTAKTAIVIVICMAILFGVMYFITTKVLDNANNQEDEMTEAVIQYDKILAGESFNQSEDEYLVVYYDSSDDYSTLSSLISTYQNNSDDKTKLYSVDLADGLNKKYIGDSVNTNSASQLKVVYPTMLRFRNHEVVETITDLNEISTYLAS